MKYPVLALFPVVLLTACFPESPVAPAGAQPALAVATLFQSAQHKTLRVDNDAADCPGADYSTIQAAVDAADPNTTILVCAGTYNERVVISGSAKDGLRLVAHGEPGAVVLDGNNPAFFPLNHAFHLLNVSGVLVEGFTVREYFENIKMTGGGGHTIRMNRTTAAGHDGIFALNSAHNVIEQNVSFDNPSGNACGVNVAGAGSVGNMVRHNQLLNNNWGIRIQNGATNTVAFSNVSRGNRSHGIQNIGATTNGSVIENNDAESNPVGIEVQLASGVAVARNRAFHNTTFDLVSAGGVNNAFVNNHCATSAPTGLCAHSDGASN
jgi:nitrous oxidase accessory protein NosD